MTDKQCEEYCKIAWELGYTQEVINKIQYAKTTVEAENILAGARQKGEYRYGNTRRIK